RHTSSKRDWSSDVCSSDLGGEPLQHLEKHEEYRTEKPDNRVGGEQANGECRRRDESQRDEQDAFAPDLVSEPAEEQAAKRPEEVDRQSGVEGERDRRGGEQ